eukprot:NODE_4190_length_362_cov_116.587859_g3747_i0.p2 GENE.NODE_4190_length_362_cov_116.587859_g3747_i0~~NODE_4190_length_362_cov_116.587859_g3747_i0.p2  ORF type:complete len:105 (+),score=46.61 NODE_4190_length_362_cov_116.587859_g3747_i0:30-317(+)
MGAVAIGRALASHDNIRTLDLSNCRIGPRGLAALAEGIHRNSSLMTLLLWGNDFSSGGADSLSKVQHRLNGILEVDFDFQVVDGRPQAVQKDPTA